MFLHFGFSKNRKGFKDAVAAGSCGGWGNYTARFDGRQGVVAVVHGRGGGGD